MVSNLDIDGHMVVEKYSRNRGLISVPRAAALRADDHSENLYIEDKEFENCNYGWWERDEDIRDVPQYTEAVDRN